MTTTYVYALIDPRLDKLAVRYVGKSVRPHVRIREHNRINGENTHKERWLSELARLDLRPEIQILQECAGDASWYEIEWIALLKAQGEPLTNLTLGGDGFNLTPEQRIAYGRKGFAARTPEERAAWGRKRVALLTKEQLSEWGRKSAAARSPERLAAQGRHMGLSQTREERSENARRQMARLTPEERKEISRKMAEAAKVSYTGEKRSAAGRKAWETRRRRQREAQGV